MTEAERKLLNDAIDAVTGIVDRLGNPPTLLPYVANVLNLIEGFTEEADAIETMGAIGREEA